MEVKDTTSRTIYDLTLLCNMGHKFYEAGQYDQAIAAFESVLKIDPESVDALSGKGNALRMKDQDEDALSFFDLALSFNPNHAFSLARKADIYGGKVNMIKRRCFLIKH